MTPLPARSALPSIKPCAPPTIHALDLQHAFNRAYDSGPYRRGAVDYTAPPQPPLTAEAAAWAEQALREPGVTPRHAG
jgi:hypothetical protein